jgi:hypothetical protein
VLSKAECFRCHKRRPFDDREAETRREQGIADLAGRQAPAGSNCPTADDVTQPMLTFGPIQGTIIVIALFVCVILANYVPMAPGPESVPGFMWKRQIPDWVTGDDGAKSGIRHEVAPRIDDQAVVLEIVAVVFLALAALAVSQGRSLRGRRALGLGLLACSWAFAYVPWQPVPGADQALAYSWVWDHPYDGKTGRLYGPPDPYWESLRQDVELGIRPEPYSPPEPYVPFAKVLASELLVIAGITFLGFSIERRLGRRKVRQSQES